VDPALSAATADPVAIVDLVVTAAIVPTAKTVHPVKRIDKIP
jgi:hypothetical protein